MKKLIIILALFSTTSLWAQWHIDLGGGVSRVYAPYPGTGAAFSGFAGAGYRVHFTPHWGLDPMLRLIWQGEKQYGAVHAIVPVLATYRISLFELGAGPFVSYGLADQKQEERYYDAYVPSVPWARSAFGYFKQFDMGLTARIGCHLSRFSLALEGNYGLLDIARKEPDDSFRAHSMGLYLVGGISF